jgi:predicted ribosomally synthesized peptide with SipW-like signal peptide
MKKAKFLALALAGAITLMGAGYAAWTDQVKLTNTVNTGRLDLHYIDLPDVKNNQGEIIEYGEIVKPVSAYVNASVGYSEDKNTDPNKGESYWDNANVVIGNMYPGAAVKFNLKIHNRSTIPVKFDGPPVVVPKDFSLGTNLTVTLDMVTFKNEQNQTKTLNSIDLSKPISTEQIKEGTDIEYTYTFRAINDPNNTNDLLEDKEYTFSITQQFKQFNY